MAWLLRRSVAALLAALATACTYTVPPPQTPTRAAVRLASPPTAPPAPGLGRVLVDTVDGPARVDRVNERTALVGVNPLSPDSGGGVQAAPLCVTPCAIDLPYGWHELRFVLADPVARRARFGTDEELDRLDRHERLRAATAVPVLVGETPSALRVALGSRSDPYARRWAGLAVLSLGTAFAAFGVAPLALGGPIGIAVGGAMLGTGLSAMLIGAALLVFSPTLVWPAAYRQWSLPDRPDGT
jgi:hypothetical protein